MSDALPDLGKGLGIGRNTLELLDALMATLPLAFPGVGAVMAAKFLLTLFTQGTEPDCLLNSGLRARTVRTKRTLEGLACPRTISREFGLGCLSVRRFRANAAEGHDHDALPLVNSRVPSPPKKSARARR